MTGIFFVSSFLRQDLTILLTGVFSGEATSAYDLGRLPGDDDVLVAEWVTGNNGLVDFLIGSCVDLALTPVDACPDVSAVVGLLLFGEVLLSAVVCGFFSGERFLFSAAACPLVEGCDDFFGDLGFFGVSVFFSSLFDGEKEGILTGLFSAWLLLTEDGVGITGPLTEVELPTILVGLGLNIGFLQLPNCGDNGPLKTAACCSGGKEEISK
jgi:hypothetical protein